MRTKDNLGQTLDKAIRFLRFWKISKYLPPNTKTILDIGCGPVPWFFSRGRAFLNATFYALDTASHEFHQNHRYHFLKHDANQPLPFRDEYFDCVTMFALLEHLSCPKRALKEVYRVLKPGGSMLLTVPTPLAKPILEFLAYRLHLIDAKSIADHKQYFTKSALERLIKNSGFSSARLSYFECGCNIFASAIKTPL